MARSGIQGTTLEVTVVACYQLDDKEWFTKQDPYVSVEYRNTKYRTKTCKKGGRNPAFHEKFFFTLIEGGLQELNVVVWNSHNFRSDNHIGNGRILLQKVLSEGHDDSSWPIQSRNGRTSGEIRLELRHVPHASQQHQVNSGSSTPQATAYPAPPPPAGYPPHPDPAAPYPEQPYPYHPPPQPPTYNYPTATPPGLYSQPPARYPSLSRQPGLYPQVYPY